MTEDDKALIRYGIQWQGAEMPICTPMSDGTWTPWHTAADCIEAQAAEIERLREECQAQYDRGYYDGRAIKEQSK